MIPLARDGSPADRREAFGELVRRFQDVAYGYAYVLLGDAQLAQDAAQDAFLAAYGSLAQLREPQAFPLWLRRIVRTHCARIRRHRRYETTSLDAATTIPTAAAGPQGLAERQEVREIVRLAIAALPERERVVVVLFYIGEQAQDEIARFLGVPVTTVKKRLQAARARLQERLLEMVRDTLGEHAPSRDTRFIDTIQFASALDTAAADADLTLVEMLLLDQMDVDEADRDGRTLLSWAAQQGHGEIVELLLRHGAQINARDRMGKTPLGRALGAGQRAVAEVLRRAGATI